MKVQTSSSSILKSELNFVDGTRNDGLLKLDVMSAMDEDLGETDRISGGCARW